MNYILEWRNADKTMLAKIQESYIVLVEPNHLEWEILSSESNIVPFEDTEVFKAISQ